MDNQVTNWWKQDTPETKSAKRLAVVLGAGAALVVVGPAVGLAVVGAINVLTLGVLGLIGVALFNVAPSASRYLTMKGNNFFLSSMKAEATKNPITTRQNNWLAEGKEIEESGHQLQLFIGEATSFAAVLKRNKTDFPNEDHSDMEQALKDMQSFAENWEATLLTARDKHASVGRKLEFAARKYEAGLTALRIQKQMTPDAQQKMLRKVMDEAAIASEEKVFGTAMAGLRIAASQARREPLVIENLKARP